MVLTPPDSVACVLLKHVAGKGANADARNCPGHGAMDHDTGVLVPDCGVGLNGTTHAEIPFQAADEGTRNFKAMNLVVCKL